MKPHHSTKSDGGDDVRHLLSTGHQILIILHGVVALDKGKLDLRKLLLQPGRKLLKHRPVPGIKADGYLPILLGLFTRSRRPRASGKGANEHEY